MRLTDVSVAEYLTARGYLEDVVRWTLTIDADAQTDNTRRLRHVVDGFVVSAGAMLGMNRNSTLAQVQLAQEQGRTHCDLVVDADEMLDLTVAMLEFIQAVEELRPRFAPPLPPGVRAFILACREKLICALPADPTSTQLGSHHPSVHNRWDRRLSTYTTPRPKTRGPMVYELGKDDSADASK